MLDLKFYHLNSVEVKLNGETYKYAFCEADTLPENGKLKEEKGKTYVETVFAEEVKLYRSAFKTPVPYSYTLYINEEALNKDGEWELVVFGNEKNILVRNVTENDIFNPEKKIAALRLKLFEDRMGDVFGSVIYGYNPQQK